MMGKHSADCETASPVRRNEAMLGVSKRWDLTQESSSGDLKKCTRLAS